MERYCVPEELTGTLLYLVFRFIEIRYRSSYSSDGGFSAYSELDTGSSELDTNRNENEKRETRNENEKELITTEYQIIKEMAKML